MVEVETVLPVTIRGVCDWGVSMGAYTDEQHRTSFGELVYRLKYRNDLSVAATIANRIVEALKSSPICGEHLLTVVPSSFTSRPFQPVTAVAKEVAASIGVDFDQGLFGRKSLTVPQKKVHDYEQKLKNVAGVYYLISPGKVRERNIALIDDLIDSGATATTLSRLLKEAGATSVGLIVFGHTQRAARYLMDSEKV